jgi:hypothetical protein
VRAAFDHPSPTAISLFVQSPDVKGLAPDRASAPATDTTTTQISDCDPTTQRCIPTQAQPATDTTTTSSWYDTTTQPATPPAGATQAPALANTPAPSGDIGGLGAGITAGETSTAPSAITESTDPTGQTTPPLDATTSSSLAADSTTPSEAQGEVLEPNKPTMASTIDPDTEAATDAITSEETTIANTGIASAGSTDDEDEQKSEGIGISNFGPAAAASAGSIDDEDEEEEEEAAPQKEEEDEKEEEDIDDWLAKEFPEDEEDEGGGGSGGGFAY